MAEEEKVEVEGSAILDLSKVKEEDKENLCKRLGGIYDKENQQCLVKVKLTDFEKLDLKIIPYEE